MIYELYYTLHLISLLRGAYETSIDLLNHPKIKYLMYQLKQNQYPKLEEDDAWELLETKSNDSTDSDSTIPIKITKTILN